MIMFCGNVGNVVSAMVFLSDVVTMCCGASIIMEWWVGG
jgi:hypothetical protein